MTVDRAILVTKLAERLRGKGLSIGKPTIPKREEDWGIITLKEHLRVIVFPGGNVAFWSQNSEMLKDTFSPNSSEYRWDDYILNDAVHWAIQVNKKTIRQLLARIREYCKQYKVTKRPKSKGKGRLQQT
jgi:hypothetical protein